MIIGSHLDEYMILCLTGGPHCPPSPSFSPSTLLVMAAICTPARTFSSQARVLGQG